MNTTTLLQYVRIITYDLKHNVDRCFPDPSAAQRFIAQCRTQRFNLYRIEKINGTWRTDWVEGSAA